VDTATRGTALCRVLAVGVLAVVLGPRAARADEPAGFPEVLSVGASLSTATTGGVQNGRLTVTYTVANRGAAPVEGVLLATTLGTGVSFASATPAADRSGQEVAWSLGTLVGFATATVRLTVEVPDPPPLGIDGGAHAFGTVAGRETTAAAAAATLRAGSVDESLLASTLEANLEDPILAAQAAALGNDPARDPLEPGRERARPGDAAGRPAPHLGHPGALGSTASR
jgi:hypothetical protein